MQTDAQPILQLPEGKTEAHVEIRLKCSSYQRLHKSLQNSELSPTVRTATSHMAKQNASSSCSFAHMKLCPHLWANPEPGSPEDPFRGCGLAAQEVLSTAVTSGRVLGGDFSIIRDKRSVFHPPLPSGPTYLFVVIATRKKNP